MGLQRNFYMDNGNMTLLQALKFAIKGYRTGTDEKKVFIFQLLFNKFCR